MVLGVKMRDQDDLEEELVTAALLPQLEFLRARQGEILLAVLAILLTCGALYLAPRFSNVEEWLFSGAKDQALAHKSDGGGGAASGAAPVVGAYGIRGRRGAMEDRIISREIKVEGGTVAVNAVLDGHGGQLSADFVRRHLTQNLERRIRLLKMLSSKTLQPRQKLLMYEMTSGAKKDGGGGGGGVTRKLLRCMGMSEEEYKQLRPHGCLEESDSEKRKKGGKKPPAALPREHSPERGKSSSNNSPKKSGESLVLSSRVKPIEEAPSLKNQEEEEEEEDQGGIESVLSLNTSSSSSSSSEQSRRSKAKKKKAAALEAEATEASDDISRFLEEGGGINYSSLLREEVAAADSALLAECKKKGHLGGTTLLLTVLDSGTLWAANVGDSRGILVSPSSSSDPKLLSYDHKPSQLKERKRIEEAGGFVSHNGVWRVQGILAVSRALGDMPLKTRGLITCEPDVLSFRFPPSSADLVLLATDGLWDVATNEEAADMARRAADKVDTSRAVPEDVGPGERLALAARALAEAAFDRGSTDNVTVLLMRQPKSSPK